MYDKNHTKKLDFTPTHIIYGSIRARDRAIFNRKIWQRQDGRVYVYIPSGQDDVEEYLRSRYFITEITREEIEELKEVVYELIEAGKESSQNSSPSSDKT